MKKSKRQPHDLVVTEEGSPIGLLTWWRLSGETTLRAVTEAANAQGFDPEQCPEPPSTAVALSRAVMEVISAKDRKSQAKDGTWHIHRIGETTDQRGKTRLTHTLILSVVYDETEEALVFDFGEDAHADAELYKEMIESQFTHSLRVLSVPDIAAFLSRQLKRALAVGLRDRGGVYMIPANTQHVWEAAVRLLEAANPACTVQEVEVRSTKKLVAELMDLLTEEATEYAKKIEDDILNDKLGSRALVTREEQVRALRDKMKSYEELLGVKMNRMQKALEGIEQTLTMAILRNDAEPPL